MESKYISRKNIKQKNKKEKIGYIIMKTKFEHYLEATNFHPGYHEAREKVQKMSKDELLKYIDSLYGRENLPDDYDENDIKKEALEQCKKDFQTKEGKQKEDDIKALAKAMFAQYNKKK